MLVTSQKHRLTLYTPEKEEVINNIEKNINS